MHYARWQTYGDPLITNGAPVKAADGWPSCDVSGCDRRSRAQKGGMCFRHYQRLRNTGTTEPGRHFISEVDSTGRLGDCEICGPKVPVSPRSDGTVRCQASRQEQRLKYHYGVTAQVFDDLVERQGGVCAICGRVPPERHGARRLFLDHDHVTGAVRAALCGSCNIALGMIRDSPELAEKLAEYLRQHGATGYAEREAGVSMAEAGTGGTT
jgi:hypothetical protein